MANISIGQIIMDAQRMCVGVKDLDVLGSALLVEAEGNNRHLESMRQFQDDIDSLNRISCDKSNAEMVNRINQQNPSVFEIRKENRELKACLEDHQRALELIMHKYREHTNNKIIESKINFKEMCNEHLWKIIREQAEKINEMAAVMQKAASLDDDNVYREIELLSKLRMENENLRELLQISNRFDSAGRQILFNAHLLQDKGIQTDNLLEDISEKETNSSTGLANDLILNSTFDVVTNNNSNLQMMEIAMSSPSATNEHNNNTNGSNNNNDNNNCSIEVIASESSNDPLIDCELKNVKDEQNSMRVANGCVAENEILVSDGSSQNNVIVCDDQVTSSTSPPPTSPANVLTSETQQT